MSGKSASLLHVDVLDVGFSSKDVQADPTFSRMKAGEKKKVEWLKWEEVAKDKVEGTQGITSVENG